MHTVASLESLLPTGGETGSARMHLTCIRAVERARVIFVRPGRKQDEGEYYVNHPLTPALSRKEREKTMRTICRSGQ